MRTIKGAVATLAASISLATANFAQAEGISPTEKAMSAEAGQFKKVLSPEKERLVEKHALRALDSLKSDNLISKEDHSSLTKIINGRSFELDPEKFINSILNFEIACNKKSQIIFGQNTAHREILNDITYKTIIPAGAVALGLLASTLLLARAADKYADRNESGRAEKSLKLANAALKGTFYSTMVAASIAVATFGVLRAQSTSLVNQKNDLNALIDILLK